MDKDYIFRRLLEGWIHISLVPVDHPLWRDRICYYLFCGALIPLPCIVPCKRANFAFCDMVDPYKKRNGLCNKDYSCYRNCFSVQDGRPDNVLECPHAYFSVGYVMSFGGNHGS